MATMSIFAFKSNLRRYSRGYFTAAHMPDPELEVGRCRFNP